MALPIIQSLWIGTELSLNEQLSIASFLYHGHEFHLYVYNELKNVPEGTILKNANSIIPEADIFQYNGGSYAGFADWFRWKLLFEEGNFWVDTDVVCLKPFDFDTPVVFGLEGKDMVCPAVLGFPKNHEMCSFLESNCRNPNKILPYDSSKIKKRKIKRRILGKGMESIKWGEAGGPEGFTKTLIHFKMLELAKPFTYFFPVSSQNWDSIYDATFVNDKTLFSDTYAIHLWNEMSRIDNFDKNARRVKGSLIEQLRDKYVFSNTK